MNKQTKRNQTHTDISKLSQDETVSEIARMLGGLKITEQTLAHAREMIAESQGSEPGPSRSSTAAPPSTLTYTATARFNAATRDSSMRSCPTTSASPMRWKVCRVSDAGQTINTFLP